MMPALRHNVEASATVAAAKVPRYVGRAAGDAASKCPSAACLVPLPSGAGPRRNASLDGHLRIEPLAYMCESLSPLACMVTNSTRRHRDMPVPPPSASLVLCHSSRVWRQSSCSRSQLSSMTRCYSAQAVIVSSRIPYCSAVAEPASPRCWGAGGCAPGAGPRSSCAPLLTVLLEAGSMYHSGCRSR
jgi:hypothetical protein